MPDVLIRGVPAAELAVLDARAAREGLSRNEYLRRRLHHEASRADVAVSADDLRAFDERFADLADDAVMAQAWS